MATPLDERLDRLAAQVDDWMRPYIEGRTGPAAPFYDMMAYHLGWRSAHGELIRSTAASGKRLRSALAILTCEALGESAGAARGAAVALELIHNFSLVHDDIQDRSEQRRGRDSVWRLFGAPQAINVGDAMFALAQLALVEHAADSPRLAEAVRCLNETCVRLVEGQFLDLELESVAAVTFELYQQMIAWKTGALLGGACALGALAANADEAMVVQAAHVGSLLGIAFQFQDDVLGIWGDPGVTGKSNGTDIVNRKKSLPMVLALTRGIGPAGEHLRAIMSSERPPADADIPTVMDLLEQLGTRAQAESLVEDGFDAVDTSIREALGAARGAELRAFCLRLRHRAS